MVFIEQPVGVGFSLADTDILYGDAQAAADNHRFVLGFFRRYPQYAKQDFFISSESYGGHYMPTLARSLQAARDVPQFRGVFLGNPLTYMPYRDYGQYGTAWGHQLLPAPLWKRYEAAGCATSFPVSPACQNITGEMDVILGGFDAYALDFDKCNTQAAAGRRERWQMRRAILRAGAASEGAKAPTLEVEGPYEPCIENFMHDYLNREDVQAAIHVKPGAKWGMCSDPVSDAYNLNDVNAPMMPIWQELIQGGDLNIMIYSGDDDSVCATLGSQQFVWDLGYGAKPGKAWKAWKVSDQVAGFVTDFAVPGEGAFRFATVHGAGHMVPATQPARSLALLQAFLAKSENGAETMVVV
jgi:carboxypeptidase C (cathepsin A)